LSVLLAAVPDRNVHAPWLAPTPPPDYPAPIVDLDATRHEALEAYRRMRADVAV
jgi:deoxyribodipyrimidine photolyase